MDPFLFPSSLSPTLFYPIPALFRILRSFVGALYFSENPSRISSCTVVIRDILKACVISIVIVHHSHPWGLTLVTTLPAPMVQPFPMVMPGRMMTLPAIQQSSPTVIFPPSSGPLVPFRRSGSNGCVPLKKETLGPTNVREPMLTKQVSSIVQLKLMKTLLPT